MHQNYPNPFNERTVIRYRLSQPISQLTKLIIYDIRGKEVRTLIKKDQSAGEYHVSWDGKDDHENEVASGIYIYRFEAGSHVASKKLVLIR